MPGESVNDLHAAYSCWRSYSGSSELRLRARRANWRLCVILTQPALSRVEGRAASGKRRHGNTDAKCAAACDGDSHLRCFSSREAIARIRLERRDELLVKI